MENPLPIGGTARRLQVVGAVVVFLAALSACGASDSGRKPAPSVSGDQRGILATVDELQAASRRDDARKICRELFIPALAKSIASASKHSCEAEVHKTLTSRDAALSVARKIDVKGSHATATVHEQNGNTSTVGFVKDGSRWRIESVKPARAP
jgi:hypothetical protein